MIRWLVILLLFSNLSFFSQNSFFIPNKGQVTNQKGEINTTVRYKVSCNNYTVSFYDNHFDYELLHPIDSLSSQVSRIELWFKNSSKNFKIKEVNQQKGLINYYKNDNPIVGIPSYESIIYQNVWEGIDIEFYVKNNVLKYNYIVYVNATSLPEIEVKGALAELEGENVIFKYSLGSLTEKIPSVYEKIERKEVKYEFFNVEVRENVIYYNLPKKRENTVVIDPIAYGVIYSTYYGGNNTDYLYSIDNNSTKDIVVGGYTFSANNIATTGAYQTTISDFDVFIAKFDSLDNRIWATYFGGSDFDRCYAIKYDNNNDIIVTGNTMSILGIASSGAFQATIASSDDAFLAKFNNAGQLLWSTYFGGNAHDFISAVDVNLSNNIFLTGHTASTNFPISGTAHNPVLNGSQSAFISAFDASGNLLHSSYYGFGNMEEGHGIRWASDNTIYMTGATSSTSEIAYGNSYQPIYQGSEDGFLVKFSASFQPIWGTYIGGFGQDQVMDIALDDSLNAYIIGITLSTSQIADSSAYQPLMNSNDDGFIMKFDSSGQRIWGTYFGGEASEYLKAAVIDSSGLWIVGNSTSTIGIVDSMATNEVNSGAYDNIILHFDKNGNKLWATYLGGELSDLGQDLVVIDSANIVICGFTNSFTGVSTDSALQTVKAGGFDGFWTKICKPLALTYTSIVGEFTLCEGDSLEVSSVNNFSSYLWSNGDSIASAVFKTTGTYWLTTLDQNKCPGRSDTIHLNIIPRNDIVINSSANNICPGDSAYLSVPDIYINYTWNNLDTAFGQFIQDSGLYWTEVIDTLGCPHFSDTISLSFSQTIFPIGTVGNTFLCQGGSTILFITPTLSNILWNNGVTTPSQSVDSTGLFWLTAINSQACSVFSDTISVTLIGYQNPVTTLDTAGIFDLCNGDTLLLEADTSFVSYSWSNGSTNSYLNINTAGQFYVVATDSNGCSAFSDTAFVSVLTSEVYFVETLNGSNYCKNDSIQVIANSSLSNVNWFNGSLQDSIYLSTNSQTYYSATDSLGCSILSDTLQLNYYTEEIPLIIQLNPDSIVCKQDILFFEVQPTIFTSYLWNNGDTNSFTQEIYNQQGAYTIDATVIDTNNCFYSISTLINVENCVDIEEQNDIQFSLYPNPVIDYLTIQSENKILEIYLYDLLGKQIKKWKVNNKSTTIDLSLFPYQGYLLELVFDTESSYFEKIIKTP